jgi:hypothetical protein
MPKSENNMEKAMAWNIFVIEKECSQRIDKNYPLMKFFSLLENLQEHIKKEKAEYDKIRRK